MRSSETQPPRRLAVAKDPAAAAPRRRGRGRWRLWMVLIGLILVAMGLVALGAIPLRAARADLIAGRAALESGQALLGQGAIDPAAAEISAAEAAFASAGARIDSPLAQPAAVTPVLGRTVAGALAVAESAELVAAAANQVVAALDDLPGGTAALAPTDGRIPVDTIAGLAEPLAAASATLDRAAARLDAAPRRLVLPPVAVAQAELTRELDQAGTALSGAAALAGELPAFLGADGPRQYFFGAQNPAELRGTGGLIGVYSILTVDDGRIDIGEFGTLSSLPSLDVDEVPAPSADYAVRYDRFGGAGFWSNINMTPDFPSAAVAIETLYEETSGVRLDGTIAADPEVMAALLSVTGPTEVPGVGMVAADTVVDYLTNTAYAALAEEPRKELLGDVAEAVFTRFLSEGGRRDPVAAGQALTQSAGSGRLLLHAADADVQAAFELAGVAGRLLDPPGDYLAVVANNAAANKIDYYLERAVAYDVDLAADGSATAVAEVLLGNGAPTTGQPAYVIGPHAEPFEAGQNLTFLSTYCAATCALSQFAQDGETAVLESGREADHEVHSNFVRLDSGQETTLRYRWQVVDAWEGDADGGTYRLTVQGQPGIRPQRLRLSVRVPAGMQVSSTSTGLVQEDGRITWDGELADLHTFEVGFERAYAEQLWGAVRRFLAQPLL